MTQPTFLVTGALGCLGSWTIKNLLDADAQVVAFDLSTDIYRWRALMEDETIARAKLVHGDISDYNTVERIVLDHGITHVIHLAALQIPFCRANPVVGAQVNVVGTVNVLQVAAKNRDRVKRIVCHASSTAVYGPPHLYRVMPVPVDAVLAPATLYGSYKQDNENCARIFFNESGVESIGLRPYVIYGVGRDRGATSSPTKAMLAAVLGRKWKIPHAGRFHFQLADDAAKTFVHCATGDFQGAAVFNLNGIVASVPEIIDAIERVTPEAKGKITYDKKPLAFPEELDATTLENAFGVLPETPLGEGVVSTMEHFRGLVEQKRIDVENALA